MFIYSLSQTACQLQPIPAHEASKNTQRLCIVDQTNTLFTS